MAAFWFWFALLASTWLLMILQLPADAAPWGVLLSALYLAGYFQAAQTRSPAWQLASRVPSLLAAPAMVLLLGQHAPAGLAVTAGLLLSGYTVIDLLVRVPARGAVPLALAGTLLALAVAFVLLPGAPVALLLVLLMAAAAGVATMAFRRTEQERGDAVALYDALLGEYRALKRSVRDSTDAARAEERVGVARRLHDSVGHKLSALLMQLEVDRLGADDPARQKRAGELKRLAQQGLDETRRAVQALGEQETAGMPALLRLIRNLEAESGMQVDFTVRQGALSVQLEAGAAVALYRAVQEALTNAMRHGSTRRVEVRFEAPGGRLFRFEISNDFALGSTAFQPGFGLDSMRERVLAAGGQLEAGVMAGRFVVRGSFPLEA